jgi:3-hydroxybutyryl-CoA dehydratase
MAGGVMFDAQNIFEIKTGQLLPVLEKKIIQEEINLYARASGDFNPIHIDEDFARKTPLGGTIAHGMLVLAYVSQMLTQAFGQSWLTAGNLNVRFKAAARPGDLLRISGKVKKIVLENQETSVSCDVLCQNQKDEIVITGEARVRIKTDENSG